MSDGDNFICYESNSISSSCSSLTFYDTEEGLSEFDSLKMDATRNISGVVAECLESQIYVDTDYGKHCVNSDLINFNFLLKMGDCVILECIMQNDEDDMDKADDIMNILKIFPGRVQYDEILSVELVAEMYVVLSDDTYCLNDTIAVGITLHLGDMVKVNVIDCQHMIFTRRAFVLTVMKTGGSDGSINSYAMGLDSKAISIIGDHFLIFTGLYEDKTITLKVLSNVPRKLRLREIECDNTQDPQLMTLEPSKGVDMNPNGQFLWVIKGISKFTGETTQSFTLCFENFIVKRSFTIIVCSNPDEAVEAKRRMVEADAIMAPPTNKRNRRSRPYAYYVWSNKTEVVPGECISTKRRFVAVRLGYYEVPEKLRRCYLTIDRRSDMIEAIEANYPCLTEALSINNYVQRFALCLHLEEIDYFISFRKYDRRRATFERDGEFLTLHIENLAERRPSLVVGDVVRASDPSFDVNNTADKTFEGIVHKVLLDRVLFKFNATFHDNYEGQEYRLEFYFSRFGFRKQHFAIARVIHHLGEQFLFPSTVTTRKCPQLAVIMKQEEMWLYDKKISWYNKGLNAIQKRAVFNILRGEASNMPYILFGPPGTGKTVTLVETIIQLVRNLPKSRLLVGTPSNSSADLITTRILESKVLGKGEFIRLVSQNQIEKDLIPPELMVYCATVDIGSVGTCHDCMRTTEKGLMLRCPMKFLGRHRVTISTCTTLGNFLQMGFPSGHFTHVLIDEAGQCTEPECMVPMVLLSRLQGQMVLAGDPHQLQAIVINRYAGEHGLRVSLLERLLDRAPYQKDIIRFPHSSGYNPMVLTKLLYNYRALPSIMAIYNKLFYDNELVSKVSADNSREVEQLNIMQKIFQNEKIHNIVPMSHGTFFYGIMGENMQEADSPSWYNPIEAREVFFSVIALYRLKITPDQIGILTPYVKQVKTLRAMFINADLAMPKIGSVEEFQGQERDVMLISTVRSTESILHHDTRLCLGFVRCNKRMNVAISRARCMMVIFGNPHLLSVDNCWRHLIRYCANNNAYYGCELPQRITESDPVKPK